MDQTVDLAALPQPSQSEASSHRWSDLVGMVASIACAFHCAAMPFVVTSLPALGLSFLADKAFHKWMAVICFGIAMAAFVPGWRKHRRLLPGVIAVVGLTLICSAAFGPAGDCCSSCSESKEVAVSTEAAFASQEVCTEACCEHCTSESSAETRDAEAESAEGAQQMASLLPVQWLARVAPWLTPVGGIILVAAHIINRRYGCLCGCCPSPADASADA